MKKDLFLVSALLFAAHTLVAQTANQAHTPSLKKVVELQMPKTEDDDMPGTRGACIAWHPIQKKYYAAFAGNMDYPLGVFDPKGKLLSDEEQTTMIDTRGLWYDAVSKMITGNAYSENGWFSYNLDKTGLPIDLKTIKEGMNQPDPQSVGVYNPVTKQVLFVYRGQVYKYDSKAQLLDSMAIHWGRKKADGVDEDEDVTEINEDYNTTSLVYTGIKGQELGFLNISSKEIELYDIKTGFLVKSLTLPETATTESTFNFAYTNGIYWLFDMEARKWIGYK